MIPAQGIVLKLCLLMLMDPAFSKGRKQSKLHTLEIAFFVFFSYDVQFTKLKHTKSKITFAASNTGPSNYLKLVLLSP